MMSAVCPADLMIVLDGSALFAILLDEPEARRCEAAIERADTLLLSAGTLAELLIVAAAKDVLDDMREFVEALRPTIVNVTAERARAAADAYAQWGRGFHPAKLNFGDCFAYALAKEHDCPLLFVGDDFARTDVAAARA
jgi:ribonuclease VapC